MDTQAKIFLAGHRGLVGSAILRKLTAGGYTNIITRTSQNLDLTRQKDTEAFFDAEQPEYVFLAAAKVGGIMANSTAKAEFFYNNMLIAANVIDASYKYGVKKLLNLGSSCIYPKLAPQPLKEEYLLTGPLEPTNDAYAIAKIAAVKMCRFYNEQYGTNFISAMPTNLYGPNDNYDLNTSHVLAAMIRKFHEAKLTNQKNVILWGTGAPYREFLYVDDLADACIYLLTKYNSPDVGEIINIGTGRDISIKDLAHLIKGIVGFAGEITWDSSKPDGTPRKLLDVSRINALGWTAKVTLSAGIQAVYETFVA